MRESIKIYSPLILYEISQPPSMSIVVPVMNSFSIAKIIPVATSSGVPALGNKLLLVVFL